MITVYNNAKQASKTYDEDRELVITVGTFLVDAAIKLRVLLRLRVAEMTLLLRLELMVRRQVRIRIVSFRFRE